MANAVGLTVRWMDEHDFHNSIAIRLTTTSKSRRNVMLNTGGLVV